MSRLTKSIRAWLNPPAKETGLTPILMNEVDAAPAPRAQEVKELQTGLIQDILALERKSAEMRSLLSSQALMQMSGVRK